MGKQFLGLKLTTQNLKAIVLNETLTKVIHQETIIFDKDLPEFKTTRKLLLESNNYMTPPTSMWLKAIDVLMERLMFHEIDPKNIAAVSGCAHQNGAVYWKTGSASAIQHITPEKTLLEQLENNFTVICDPIFMDPNTTKQQQDFEKIVGGREKFIKITGSVPNGRQAGPQIAKIYQLYGEMYKNTERISLPSSFLSSLFVGKIVPIDTCDASNTGLLDVQCRNWHECLTDSCGSNLSIKLRLPIRANTSLGSISQYFCRKYGFSRDCEVIAFTSNEGAYAAGLRLRDGCMAINLDESDSIILWSSSYYTSASSQTLCCPLDDQSYLITLNFRNGDNTRLRIRDTYSQGCWQIFNEQLKRTPKGNSGNLGLYFDVCETAPPFKGDIRYKSDGSEVEKFKCPDEEVRALIEGQFLARRFYLEKSCYKLHECIRIIVTGKSAWSTPVLQTLADIFQTSVYVEQVSVDFALYGSAYRAKHGLDSSSTLSDIVADVPPPILKCRPDYSMSHVYDRMTSKFKQLHGLLVQKPTFFSKWYRRAKLS